MTDEPEAIVRRNLWPAISLLAPGTVIGYRTALEMAPAADGAVFLTGTTRKGQLELPGITLRLIPGPGPLEGDQPLFNLHIASRPRALLEVLKPSRARATVARGLPRARVEEELERELRIVGEERLNRIRDQARAIAPVLDAEREFAVLDGIIGALLGTKPGRLSAPAAVARAAGEPYDAGRLDRFQVLHAALVRWIPRPRPDALTDDSEFANVAFFDAYFSNFIEGTRFDVAEARGIALEGKIPAARPADAHDILGTYRLVGSRTAMGRGVRDYPDFNRFLTALQGAHADILSARPDKRPGEFKVAGNVAGETMFVAPDLVRGTLRQGFELARSLEAPFARAVTMMFIISEVHPFDDGNGRIARAFMNAELVSGGERRILIATVYRDEYVTGLRVHTRQGHPDPLIKTLDFAQDYAARIDFRDYDRALAVLRDTGAFEEPGPEVRLRLPELG
ncbi:MAG TPA: Fic family protein [Gemmatimonadales bacterium]|nr:Fic family protein [Gemmatimonadales bacterium]